MKTFRVKEMAGRNLGIWDFHDTPRSGDVVSDVSGNYQVLFCRWDRQIGTPFTVHGTLIVTDKF